MKQIVLLEKIPSSRIISLVIFYEQSQRGRNLLTQMWCLVYLSAGFNLSFPLKKGTRASLPVTSVGFTKNYHILVVFLP
jgi:hypothetical protein